MSTPKHRTAAGSSYFVTTKCSQGRTIFQIHEVAETLVNDLFEYRDRSFYPLHDSVLMPDHLHILLTAGMTTSLEKARQLIKSKSSHKIHKLRNHKMEIWQVGSFEWRIRCANDWQTKVEYIHLNPFRGKLVECPREWAYSSANGKYAIDPVRARNLTATSGAKALVCRTLMPDLKLRPPKEHHG